MNSLNTDLRIKAKQTAPAQQQSNVPAVPRNAQLPASAYGAIALFCNRHPRLLMRGLAGARAEIGIATIAYNLKRMTNVLGAGKLTKTLLHA